MRKFWNTTNYKAGHFAEKIALFWLMLKGYWPVAVNFVVGRGTGAGEVDLIVRRGKVLVFVEVKTRRDTIFHTPEEAVDYRKMNNLRRAINHYVKYRKIDNPIRFDIITVVGSLGCPHPIINHIEDVYKM